MDVTYEWCRGRTFIDVCKMTEVFEGTVVRVFKRLEELLKQISMLAKSKMENHDLADRLGAAMEKLRRGIVSSASLYI